MCALLTTQNKSSNYRYNLIEIQIPQLADKVYWEQTSNISLKGIMGLLRSCKPVTPASSFTVPIRPKVQTFAPQRIRRRQQHRHNTSTC